MGGFIIGGVVVAGLLVLGIVLSRALQGSVPDAEAASPDLLGSLGTVVLRIPESGSGEVTITQPDSRLRVSARSETPIEEGATVVVVDVPSADAVVVTESGF